MIEGNYIYIDKTKEVLDLINNYKYVFLSRPRRFGKSLFLDTLKEAFEGNKDLFKGLYIYDKYDFPKHPVIKISWAGDLKSLQSTKNWALLQLRFAQEKLNITCEENKDPSTCFGELIQKTYQKHGQKVVVLIDEYDKPILDNLEKENLEVAKENREFLRGFYSVIKDSDAYIRFAFLTGVSRFSRVSIFSGLNNLVDISLNPKYAYICGFTHQNLQNEFKEYLQGVDLEEVRKWYNGYNFLGKEKLYNPFDILLFIDSGYVFDNYWFKTGTPSFLIKLLKDRGYNVLQFENLEVGSSILDSFDIDRLEVETIMFQAGYLTIKEVIEEFGDRIFVLTFPNFEVKKSFNDYLLDYLTVSETDKVRLKTTLRRVLIKAQLDKLKDVLTSLYASVPYHLFVRKEIRGNENYYAVVLYMYLAGAGIDVYVEDTTDRGRADLTAIVIDKVYIFEIKMEGEGDPIDQIKEKRYYEKYLNYPQIYAVGIIIDKQNKTVKDVVWEKVK
ncbi:MAG: AAA family ATPase [Aquificae bacterium]|nr:AAA family ATPase [Aquificota bacterium]